MLSSRIKVCLGEKWKKEIPLDKAIQGGYVELEVRQQSVEKSWMTLQIKQRNINIIQSTQLNKGQSWLRKGIYIFLVSL